MTKQMRERIVKILRSGEFTFSFHDSQDGTLIPRKATDYAQAGEFEEMGVESYSLEMGHYGDELVELLIEALGGNLHST